LRYSLFQVKSVLNLKVSGSEKLLSVDIFDTLLFRLVESPFEIFDEVGLRSKSEGLLSPTIMEQEFSMLRRSAEQDARKDQFEKYGHNEVTLDQIYEFLPDFIGDKPKLQSLEVKTECEFCYLNPEILKLIEDVNRRNLPVVLTSDMYLNKEQLEDILRSNEFDLNLIKQIYVSCEHSGNKSSGALFRKLQSDYSNIPPEKILHVGDKIEADFHSPRSLGIKAYHYSTTPEGLNKIFEHEKICLTPPSKLTSLRRLAVRFTRKADSIENQLGAGILGPVFTAFVEWVLDLCEQEKISQVFPLTREAELFHPMLENASKGRSWKVKIEPLYVSRESTWLASLTDWNEEELDDLLEKHSISVLEIFQTLGISLPKSFDLEYQDLKAGDLNPKQRENLRDYLLSDSVVESVNQRIASQCESLIEYLDQTVDMTQKSLTVDLGFRGTINSNIEKVMSKERVDSNFVHLLAFGANSTIELKMRGIKVLSFLASPSINQDYLSVIRFSWSL
jgi:FMN phosphatase YigB (HAD superfamily)